MLQYLSGVTISKIGVKGEMKDNQDNYLRCLVNYINYYIVIDKGVNLSWLLIESELGWY